MKVVTMFLQLLKKKSQEINFAKIRGSKCRGNLKSQTVEKEEKSVEKMYLIEQKSCKLLPQIEKKKMRTNVGDGKRKLGVLLHFIGKTKRKICFSKK